MSMPSALDRYYTREDVLAFPDDGNRYELVYGELLVSPSPRHRHQWAILQLATALNAYVQHQRIGTVGISPADLSFGRRDLIIQPDLFVVAGAGAESLEWDELRQLLLVVEVLSPSTSRSDRFTKRRLYQDLRIPVYWIIDPEQRRAEVWTPDATEPTYETARLTWHPPGASEGLSIELSAVFPPTNG